LDELIQRKNVIRFIKSQGLKWLGHVERIPKEREVTGIYTRTWKPLASRPIGRPKMGRRCEKGLAEDEDYDMEEECIEYRFMEDNCVRCSVY
jgi:hypothetical protein